MFFKSLFMRFSFFKKWKMRRTKETLDNLYDKVDAQGAFENEDITTLHSIVKTSVISFNEEMVRGTTDTISFFTKTSMKAMSALEKKEVVSVNLAKSKDVSLTSESRQFDEWYSNQTSVEEFVNAMTLRLEQQAILYNTITEEETGTGLFRYNLTPVWNSEIGGIGFEQFALTEEDRILFESQLYRILLLDLIGILRFYMDHQLD